MLHGTASNAREYVQPLLERLFLMTSIRIGMS